MLEHERALIRKEKVAKAFQQLFAAGEHADLVLAELASYGRFLESTFVQGDSHAMAKMEGRREMFLMILESSGRSYVDVIGSVRKQLEAMTYE